MPVARSPRLERRGCSRAGIIFLACLPVVAVFVLDGWIKQPLHTASPSLYWAFDVAKFVLLPCAILGWMALRAGITPASYGLRAIAENESWAHFLGLTVFLGFALDLVYRVAFWTGGLALGFPETTSFYHSIRPDGLLRIPVAVYYGITAGIVEEVFFRGLPLLYLSERYGKAIPRRSYVLVTALLFSAAHWEDGSAQIVATFVFGLFAGAIYLKLRDLWPLVCAHLLMDVWAFW